jgi:hypothetical protein
MIPCRQGTPPPCSRSHVSTIHAGHNHAGSRQAGRQQAGRQQAGRQQAGRQQAAGSRQAAGKQAAGKQAAGSRQAAGKQAAGKQAAGRPCHHVNADTLHHAPMPHDPCRQQAGAMAQDAGQPVGRPTETPEGGAGARGRGAFSTGVQGGGGSIRGSPSMFPHPSCHTFHETGVPRP